MRNFIILFLFSILVLPAFGQKKARDFKVVTTDKKTVELYKDFLSKGKVVLIKIFFVDCPPCNDIAPQISQLYKKYDRGQGKVEFIELSNKAWDTDPMVIGYKLKYDLPCPSVSNDGGSVQASNLYSDNFYGPFFGTPTFIVIRPDGTVQYDVRGGGKNETITNLDSALTQAIRSTIPIVPPADTIKPVPPKDTTKPVPPKDTIKPTPGDTIKPVPPKDTVKPKPIDTIKISGKLSFKNQGLGLVPMKINMGTKEIKFATDIQGNFNVVFIDSVQARLPAVVAIEYNQEFGAEVSAVDLLLIQKHILGLARFNDYKQLIAGDANGDSEINTLDMLELRRLILGLVSTLPNNVPSIHFLWQNANGLVKSLASPINFDDLKSMSGKPFNIEVVKTGNVE